LKKKKKEFFYVNNWRGGYEGVTNVFCGFFGELAGGDGKNRSKEKG